MQIMLTNTQPLRFLLSEIMCERWHRRVKGHYSFSGQDLEYESTSCIEGKITIFNDLTKGGGIDKKLLEGTRISRLLGLDGATAPLFFHV